MKMLLALVAALMLFSQLSKCGGSEQRVESEQKKKDREAIAALGNAFGLCQKAILTFARDPDKSEVPYLFPDLDSKGNWVWSWSQKTKMLRLKNGFGTAVAATGLCVVDRTTLRIEMLIIDDKLLLSSAGSEYDKPRGK